MGSYHQMNRVRFIKLTVVAEDGTSTVIEIPVGTGNFAQDPDGGSGG